jgi:deazaflavin-dependent oxidoreductase (nitroreductase family)
MSTPRSAPRRRAPRWLKLLNRINRPLLVRGIGPAPQHLLSIPGRRSGRLRTTPVAVITYRSNRYIIAGYAGSDWVHNARHAGWAELHRGRRTEHVRLDEVPVDQRPPILREFAREVPGGRAFLSVKPDATDAELAAAAVHHPTFRLESDPTG